MSAHRRRGRPRKLAPRVQQIKAAVAPQERADVVAYCRARGVTISAMIRALVLRAIGIDP